MEPLPKISFCLTPSEAEAVDEARRRLGKQGVIRNRSEVVRLAIGHLTHLDDDSLSAAADQVTRLKPGRRKPATK